ncbi:MAG: TylF/MycF family methyltransferase [Thermoplasmata archaeon]|nr:TylF/MycF family methyltransferase [Thermoplasmata archaeon]
MSGTHAGRFSARGIASFSLEHPEFVANLLRRVSPKGSYRATFYFLLLQQRRFSLAGVGPWGSYYEFGVGGGDTLVAFVRAIRDFERTAGRLTDPFHVFAFDSFQGLPAPTSTKDQHSDGRRGWRSGDFAHSLGEVRRKIALQEPDLGRIDLNYVSGFYENSLTAELRGQLQRHPPAIVLIDVDFYSSTRTILDWLGPILRSGTQFYFDDVWSFRGDPEKGELAAIAEFNRKGNGFLVNYPVDAGMNLVSPRYVFFREETGPSMS